jgi:hypothetical protein
MQERMAMPEQGLLDRYDRGIQRLESRLQKGDYPGLAAYIRTEILPVWRTVELIWIRDLHLSSPDELSTLQITRLRVNQLKVRQVVRRLRRVRRLITRAEKLDRDNRSSLKELTRLERRFEKSLAELESQLPDRAEAFRRWQETELLSRLESLRIRDRALREHLANLGRLGGERNMREWLRQIQATDRTIESLLSNRH